MLWLSIMSSNLIFRVTLADRKNHCFPFMDVLHCSSRAKFSSSMLLAQCIFFAITKTKQEENAQKCLCQRIAVGHAGARTLQLRLLDSKCHCIMLATIYFRQWSTRLLLIGQPHSHYCNTPSYLAAITIRPSSNCVKS